MFIISAPGLAVTVVVDIITGVVFAVECHENKENRKFFQSQCGGSLVVGIAVDWSKNKKSFTVS